MRRGCLSVISFEARWLARLPDGRRAFVKAGEPRRVRRDKACLQALAGLAVPRRVPLPVSCLPPKLPLREAVAEEWVPGAALDHAGLAPLELLGAWAFVVEQLAAFRRCEVLYTDVKCANVLALRRPLSARLIDFDFATAVSRSGRYGPEDFGYTQGFEAPEHARAETLDERAIVYQAGMLLLHCWTGARNEDLAHPRRGLPRLRRDLEKLAAEGAARLAARALARSPDARPRGFEELLAGLRTPGCLPAGAREAWRVLRKPYERALARLRLDAP